MQFVAIGPDRVRIASGADDKTVRLWDAASGELLETLTGHEEAVQSAAFSPDGTRIASGSVDKTVRLWDAASGDVSNGKVSSPPSIRRRKRVGTSASSLNRW